MNELIKILTTVFADAFSLYLKAQNFHWNIENRDFPMYHTFFGDFYEEVYGSIDPVAELIRTLDEKVPQGFKGITSFTNISDDPGTTDAHQMIGVLYDDNQKILADLVSCYNLAERYSKFGISNFIQGRIEAHEKHAWMLRSMMRGGD